MTHGQLQIHSENILPIIKKWLYSDKDIFVRELVSNACDASHKLQVLREEGQAPNDDEPLRVVIAIDKEARTLTFSDHGLGMDAAEVEKYICQLAFSGAEEFLAKYKSNEESDRIIGHFGLGFYSAYMVANKVTINTLSYREGSEPVLWTCEGGTDYQIEKGTRTQRGTDIILHIDAENDEYLDYQRLKGILDHYCSFLPYPVYLNDQHINSTEPLWIKAPSACTDQDYIDFYRRLYPGTADPLFWIHLNVDYPFHLKGILYFPKLERQIDLRKSSVKLYCNRVFVSDNCKDLIPEYLMVLRGAIDSPDIPLNVSRSHLQMDRTVRQLAGHISKKVSDTLSVLYRTNKERFLAAWKDISVIVKLGAVEDEKFFERVQPLLLWRTVGGEWMTVEEYLERNKEKTKDKVLYTAHEKHAMQILQAYRDRNVEVLCADHPIDAYLIHSIEKKISPAKFQRIDADVDETLIDSSREQSILDAEGKTAGGRLADFFRRKLNVEGVEIEAKSLMSNTLPAILVMDEQARRFQEYMQTMDQEGVKIAGLIGSRTLVLNTNSSLLTAVAKLDEKDPELASELAQEVYELALLGQHELKPDALSEFVSRSHKILEALAKKAIHENV